MKYQKGITVRAGTTFRVDVPYQGTPKPTIKWSRDDKPIEKTLRVSLETTDYSAALITRSAERSDSGDYIVTASNKAGTDSGTVNVKVIDRSTPPQGPLQVVKLGANDVTLAWNPPSDDGGTPITGYILEKRDASRFMWTKIGPALTETSHKVVNLTENEEYQFRVRAENKCGTSDPLEGDKVIPKGDYGKFTHMSVLFFHINM